jgi:hypothetical protein
MIDVECIKILNQFAYLLMVMFKVTRETVYGIPYLPYENLGITKYLYPSFFQVNFFS